MSLACVGGAALGLSAGGRVAARPRLAAAAAAAAPRTLDCRRLVCRRPAAARRATRLLTSASAAGGPETRTYNYLTKAEIPGFLPRADFIKQVYRWAQTELEQNGPDNIGMPVKMQPIDAADGFTVGFHLTLLRRDPATGQSVAVCNLECKMDEEEFTMFERVDRSDDKTGIVTSKPRVVKGKHFVISKEPGDTPQYLKDVLKKMVTMLVEAINSFYAFGSAFSGDDS